MNVMKKVGTHSSTLMKMDKCISMTNNQRAYLLMHTSAKLDYYTPRYQRGENRESEEQFLYYTNMMKFLITKMDTSKTIVRQNGTGIVFPSL